MESVFPDYVWILCATSCVLKKTNAVGGFATYYRRAGDWDLDARIEDDGQLISIREVDSRNGKSLLRATEEQHKMDNETRVLWMSTHRA